MFRKLIASIIFLFCGFTYAQADQLDSSQLANSADYPVQLVDLTYHPPTEPSSAGYDFNKPPVFLAAANEPSSSMSQHTDDDSASEYEDRIFTGNKVHKYLGIGSIGAALLTLISPKEEDGAHESLAKISAALGAGAVATGFAYHYDDVSVEGGFRDPDNLHALWAGLGALGIALAATEGPDSPHATYGSLGAISMMVGIKYTW